MPPPHHKSSGGQTVRIVIIDGEPWSVAADVCRCLGFDVHRSTAQRLKPLDADERRSINTLKTFEGIKQRGNPNVTVISMSGLFKLVLRAQRSNPAACLNRPGHGGLTGATSSEPT
ncbi:MAG: Bro-N domain-containing protein [Methylobacterium mesophilicum]|nr:Bro-N domain-containing protein [Methylobacterium mesophilicum]